MISRRRLAISAAQILCASPFLAAAKPSRIRLRGAVEQGALVVGSVPPGTQLKLDGKDLRLTPDGVFAFGLHWNETGSRTLAAIFPDSSSESRDLPVAQRTYLVQEINGIPEKYVEPDPVLIARINAENGAIIKIRDETDSNLTAFETPFDWPASGIISSIYGSQRIFNGEPRRPHMGVDVAGKTGTPIYAPADGQITCVMPDCFMTGGTTVIDHGYGVSSSFFHQSKIDVTVGQVVKRGDKVGEIGATGRATGPHLHWSLNWFDVRLDPNTAVREPKKLGDHTRSAGG